MTLQNSNKIIAWSGKKYAEREIQAVLTGFILHSGTLGNTRAEPALKSAPFEFSLSPIGSPLPAVPRLHAVPGTCWWPIRNRTSKARPLRTLASLFFILFLPARPTYINSLPAKIAAADFLALTRHHNIVRDHRTGADNSSDVEEYLEKKIHYDGGPY